MNDSMFECIALSLHDSHVKAGSVGLATVVTRNVVQSRGLYLIEEEAAAQKAGRQRHGDVDWESLLPWMLLS